MTDWMHYMKIQELKRDHLNKSQASRKLGLDYKMICKYWDMPAETYAEIQKDSKKRTKKADSHKDFVVECLRKYPDMTAAQIYDWMKSFRAHLKDLFSAVKAPYAASVPQDYMLNHMVCDFAEAMQWWSENNQYSPEDISGFFLATTPVCPCEAGYHDRSAEAMPSSECSCRKAGVQR